MRSVRDGHTPRYAVAVGNAVVQRHRAVKIANWFSLLVLSQCGTMGFWTFIIPWFLNEAQERIWQVSKAKAEKTNEQYEQA